MGDGGDDKKESRTGAWRVVTELVGEVALADLHDRCSPETFSKRDGIRAELIFAPDTPQMRTLGCQVHRLSPFAVELLPHQACPPLLPARFVVDVRLGGQTLRFHPPTLFRTAGPQGGEILAAKLVAPGAVTEPKQNQRRIPRWRCHPDFLPAASAPHPLRGGEFLQFKVADLSSQGMQLLGSMKYMFVLPQTKLVLTVTLPEMGKVSVKAQVAYASRVQLNDKAHMAFGMRFVDINSRALAQMTKYVATHAGNQLAADQEAEPSKSLVPAMSFRWVQSDSDYDKAIALRRVAGSEGGTEPSADAAADPYDKRARILLVLHKNAVIATLRMVYSQPGEGLEIEQFTDLSKLKLSKDALVEVSQLCTHPDYRRPDLLGSVMHFAMLTAVQSGRRYVLTWCAKDMLPAYERLGCDASGIVLSTGFADGKPRHVIVADTQKLLHGGASAQAFKHFVGALGQSADARSYPNADEATDSGADKTLGAVAAEWTSRVKAFFRARK